MYPGAEAVASVAREAQAAQLGTIDALDTKASAIAAFDGLLLTLLFTSGESRSHWNVLLTAGAASLAASVLPLLIGLLPRRYMHNPNVIALAGAFLTRPAEEANRLIALSIARAIAHNQNILRWKVQAMRIGLELAALGIAFTAAGLIYSVTR